MGDKLHIDTAREDARLRPSTVVFDLGNVLIGWDPYQLYRTLLPSDTEIKQFFDDVQIFAWNAEQDAGRPWNDAVAELSAQYPHYAHLIAAWHERWHETIAGPIDGTVEILRELRDDGVPLYALTNWSDEKFPIAQERFDFLDWFDGIVVSGTEEITKPDPRIYQILFERYDVDPAAAVFIDDSPANVAAATALGVTGLHYTDSAKLRGELADLGLITTR